MFLNNGPIPKSICDREPELYKRGLYRKLDSGQVEFISWCNPKIREYLGAWSEDVRRIGERLAEGNE